MNLPQSLTPSKLRIVLIATITLTILAGAAVFYLAYNKLGAIAAETGERAASAEQSQDTLQRLQSLKTELGSRKDDIDTAAQVIANSQNYAYQDRLVNDLTIYAGRANLEIRNISFTDQGVGAPAPQAGEGGAAAPTIGLKKATVDITLDNPVSYQNLLNFLHYIEQNLTKLRVSKVVMTKSEGDNVTIDVLNLEVYVR